MESAATDGALPKVARVVKRLLDEGRRDAAQRAAGGPKELRYLEHTYHLAGGKAPRPVRLNKPPKEAGRRGGNGGYPAHPKRMARRHRELAKMTAETAWRLECVERVACAVFQVSRATLPSRSQSPPVMSARIAFCVLAEELVPTATVTQIMRFVARNHATLRHYREQFPLRIESDFQSAIVECRRQLGRAFGTPPA
jgi:hypothetical protein